MVLKTQHTQETLHKQWGISNFIWKSNGIVVWQSFPESKNNCEVIDRAAQQTYGLQDSHLASSGQILFSVLKRNENKCREEFNAKYFVLKKCSVDIVCFPP